jgi:hypothetical protein
LKALYEHAVENCILMRIRYLALLVSYRRTNRLINPIFALNVKREMPRKKLSAGEPLLRGLSPDEVAKLIMDAASAAANRVVL